MSDDLDRETQRLLRQADEAMRRLIWRQRPFAERAAIRFGKAWLAVSLLLVVLALFGVDIVSPTYWAFWQRLTAPSDVGLALGIIVWGMIGVGPIWWAEWRAIAREKAEGKTT